MDIHTQLGRIYTVIRPKFIPPFHLLLNNEQRKKIKNLGCDNISQIFSNISPLFDIFKSHQSLPKYPLISDFNLKQKIKQNNIKNPKTWGRTQSRKSHLFLQILSQQLLPHKEYCSYMGHNPSTHSISSHCVWFTVGF